MILIDPKRVELTQYEGIPHLLSSVIVEPPKVVSALKWATKEMDNRYKLFAEAGVRNIDDYNEKAGFAALAADAAGTGCAEPTGSAHSAIAE